MAAYSSKLDGAKAYGRRIDVSPKHVMEICSHIKGMSVKKADDFLGRVQRKEEYVPLKRFNKQTPHRSGGQPGRYHVKAAKIVQLLLRSAASNGEQAGMDKEKMRIVHASAHRGPAYARKKPKGRWQYQQIDTAHIEIIVK